MKRWFTMLLAVMMVLAAVHAGAEAPLTNAEIEESLATRENAEPSSLATTIGVLAALLLSEDVQSLLEFEDVKEVVNEVLVKIILWMYENRPVTFEIFTELGMGETEQILVGRIWDSMDRVIDSIKEYVSSEEGIQLASAWNELLNDEAFIRFKEDFINLADQDDILNMMNAFVNALQEGGRELQEFGEKLQESGEGKPDAPTSIEMGTLFLKKGLKAGNMITDGFSQLMNVVTQSEWATESLPALLEKECFWNAIRLTSEIKDSVVFETIGEEMEKLREDEMMRDYLSKIIASTVELIRNMMNKESSSDNPS